MTLDKRISRVQETKCRITPIY